jgi:uncharacterized protein YifN (PemK superfamily)
MTLILRPGARHIKRQMVVVHVTRLKQTATLDGHFIVEAEIDDSAKAMFVDQQLHVTICQELQSVASKELALGYLPA